MANPRRACGVIDGLAAREYEWTAFAGCKTKQGFIRERLRACLREGMAGTVFVLTLFRPDTLASGPSTRPNATGRGFLGYLQEEIFWKDALELVHEDDLPLLRFLVSLVMEEPGASESVEVRFRDARGDWVLMDVCVLNVLEAPQVTTRDFSS